MVFLASDIFSVVEVTQNFPLNLKFELKDLQTSFNFSEPILYSILFDGNIIYVGYSFDDKQKDIRKSRWSKQLETILFRGYRVGLNKKSFREFESSLKHKLSQSSINTIRIAKKDVMTSVNRIAFATKHWKEIEKLDSKNDSLLNRFYFQIEFRDKNTTKKEIQERVKDLIEQKKPSCNG
jgi:hypothetical protein